MKIFSKNLKIHKTATLLCCLFLFLASAAMQARTVRYVKQNGSGNGLSWAQASDDLQKMIKESDANQNDEIWVYSGLYKPIYTADNWNPGDLNTTTAVDRNNAFILEDGVKIYGGFSAEYVGDAPPAFGSANRNGVSILSGDLSDNDNYADFTFMVNEDNDDDTGAKNRLQHRPSFEDNAYHVVLCVASASSSISNETLLDGFTIRGGFGAWKGGIGYDVSITVNGTSVSNQRGGGIFNGGISGNKSYAKFSNLIITHNNSEMGGGIYNGFTESGFTDIIIEENLTENWGTNDQNRGAGVCNLEGASPTFTNVDIRRNHAANHGGSWGGGIYNSTDGIILNTSPVFNNVTVTDNRAMHGAGVYNRNMCDPIFYNVKIEGNSAQGSAGGVMNRYFTIAKFINVAIIDNEDSNGTNGGGGIRNEGTGATWPDVTLTNVTVAGNKSINATNGGGGIYIDGDSKVILQNSIVYGNTDKNGVANDVGIYSGNILSVLNNSLLGTMGNIGFGTGSFSLIIPNSVIGGNPEFFVNPTPTSAGDYRLKNISD
ncbi:MAG: hypothetical protein LBT42_01855, partial [Tannerella sp.]|nr:hypothetical protein [Tannerella sp.]